MSKLSDFMGYAPKKLNVWRSTDVNCLPISQQAALKLDILWAIASPVRRWTGSLFLALNTASTNSHPTSPDGKTWTVRTFPYTQIWRGIADNGAGRVIATGGTNTTQAGVSTDGGITWGALTLASTADWGQIEFGNGYWLVVTNGTGAGTNYSSNGTSFSIGAAPSLLSKVKFLNNRFFVGSAGLGTYYTTDAQNYTATTGLSTVLASMAYGNSIYMGPYTGSTNQIAYSTNGTSFSIATLPVIDTWADAYFDTYSGLFVLVASTTTGVILTSPDCLTWTQRKNLDFTGGATAVLSGPSAFVVQQGGFLRQQDRAAVEVTYLI